ncbi:RDD family protein [Candidatus Woesearchaeota archaeon]|nr:RDD family protein [Candidatus Woesearchaeota archaeon]
MKKRGESFIAPASIPRRIFAFILDLIIINFLILAPFDRVFRKIIPSGTVAEQLAFLQNNPQIMSLFSPLLVIMSILVIFYLSYFGYALKQTPGRMILGIYIVPERKITFRNYLLSNITFVFAPIFIILWIIDFVYMITSPKSQRLMEKLNKILVVQRYKYPK